MKTIYLSILLLSVSPVMAYAQNNTAETQDDEFYDAESDEEQSDVQERLEKARQQEAAQAAYTSRGQSLLTDAQRNQLNNQASISVPAPKATPSPQQGEHKSRYDKPKRDWSFKDPFQTKTGSNTSQNHPSDTFGLRRY